MTYWTCEILRTRLELSIRDCVLMFDVYAFQMLCLLIEYLTHYLAIFFTDIDQSGPSTTPRR